MKQFSYSAVSSFEQCPFQYKCRYLDGLRALPTDDPANALVIGSALHKGIETDVDTAIGEYFATYPIITDQHIDEEIKLRYLIPKVKEILPEGTYEVRVQDNHFIGFLDLLVPVSPSDMPLEEKDEICDRCDKYNDCGCVQSGRCPCGKYDGYYDLYDFKYSNHWVRYMESRQLHLYKYYWEKANPGKHIRNMYFVFVPKVQIRQKKTETQAEFRQRLVRELHKVSVKVEQVHYNPQKVIDHLELTQQMLLCEEFPQNPTRLCDWCDYKTICQGKGDYDMALPSTSRVPVDFGQHKKIWIYGAPFSGKTTVCDGAPTPLNLNTDGNVKTVTMARLPIKDTVEGRQKKLAWDVFKAAVDDLEAGSDFETIVVDLLEDTYESCRLWMYKQMGITHESDDTFRAWDKVRTEFLSTFRRLLNLPYNIVLISHEDTSKDITKRSGDKITAIKPNIQDKIANKIAGMVDIVLRATKDGDTYLLSTKTSDVVFGGGRLAGMKSSEFKSSWAAIEALYGNTVAVEQPAPTPAPVSTPAPVEPTPVSEDAEIQEKLQAIVDAHNTPTPAPAEDEQPKRRVRRTRE